MDKVILTFLIIIASGGILSLLLAKFIKNKWLWYVPSFIGVLIITYFQTKIYLESMEGHDELGYIIISMMILAFIVGNVLTNAFITMRRRTINK